LVSKFNGLLVDRGVLKHVIDAGRKYFRTVVTAANRAAAQTHHRYLKFRRIRRRSRLGRPAGFDEETTK
jgi:hypothetical protein